MYQFLRAEIPTLAQKPYVRHPAPRPGQVTRMFLALAALQRRWQFQCQFAWLPELVLIQRMFFVRFATLSGQSRMSPVALWPDRPNTYPPATWRSGHGARVHLHLR
jgi:hypothetical protein